MSIEIVGKVGQTLWDIFAWTWQLNAQAFLELNIMNGFIYENSKMLKQGSYTGNSGTLLRFILHSLTTIWLLLCRRTVKHRKARCDNHQQAFSCFGRNCAEPTKFTLQRWSVRACRSSPTTATRQAFCLILRDASWFVLAKTRWSTVVRPRIDHYWKLTTLQDWNTL